MERILSYSNLPILSSDNGLSRYLQEIRKFPMLEPEEEYMLVINWPMSFSNFLQNNLYCL
jgi:DNA-directed RNA polymerase sigma subunit (sigma70/sigma32)